MNQFTLKKNIFEVFNRVNSDLIDRNLDDLNNDFKYLFLIPLFPVYDVDWGGTNNLSAIINRGQQQKNLLSDKLFILNNLLTKIAILNIINTDSATATQTPFNTLFDTKSMIKFYAINSSFLLACHYFKECNKD